MKSYIVNRENPECICSLNGCPENDCKNELSLLDNLNRPMLFGSIKEAKKHLQLHINKETLKSQLKDQIIKIEEFKK